MRHMFEAFGNPSAVQRAIEEATPNRDKIQEAAKRLERITEELTKLERSRQRILDLVVKGTIADDSATAQLEKAANLNQPDWSSIGPVLHAQGGVLTLSDPTPGATNGFYRVRLAGQ